MIYRCHEPGVLKPAASWSPLNIPDCLTFLWSEAGTDTTTDGAEVATWTDQSGNGNNAVQNTAGNKPIYKANIVNGKPVLRFDGVNDHMSISGAANYSAASLVLVVKATTAGQRAIFSNRHLSAPPGGCLLFAGISGTSKAFAYLQGSGNQVAEFGSLTATWMAIYFILSGDTTMEIFINNVSQGSNTGTSRILSLPNGYLGLDGGAYWGSDYAAVLMYGHALTIAERGNLQTWFNRFGL